MQNHEKSAFRRARSAGFTFLELMMVLIVAIILVGVGVPTFKDSVAKYRMENTRRALSDTLLTAREESINGEFPVTVCASTDGKTCDTDDWSQGQIVFYDPNNQGEVDSGEKIVLVGGTAREGITITGIRLPDNAEFTRGYLVFNQGELDLPNAIQFETCKVAYLPQRTTVGRNGRISTSKGTQECS
jgi:Tfp pilus assembly protein FimT